MLSEIRDSIPPRFTLPRREAPEQARTVRHGLPGLRIGIAEYESGPTGCTVLHFPAGARATTDIRGGAPGVIGGYERVDALCLAGGSLYGLAATSGVSGELLAQRRSARWGRVAVVAGAIIYDFGPRDTLIHPDAELGRQALLAATEGVCPVGRQGAGRLASVGKIGIESGIVPEAGGQGAAFGTIGPAGGAVFVITVVNSLGVIVDRAGRVVRGCVDAQTGQRYHPRDLLLSDRKQPPGPATDGRPTTNTTLTAVVTNLRLPDAELRQLGRQVHSSMARSIQPFHTPGDGDVLFTLSTDEVSDPALDYFALAEVASELAWDAVLSAVE